MELAPTRMSEKFWMAVYLIAGATLIAFLSVDIVLNEPIYITE